MSTYNGQKFLEKQIQSILNQTNHDWHLYIRDDGSTDKTCEIIRYFTKKYDCISFINDNKIQNVGVVKSFMSLLQSVDAEFYMFSDQDDFWLPNKIQLTLDRMLQSHYQSLPVCVHTNLKAVDSSLKNEIPAYPKIIWSSFQRLLFWNCVTGCTMMINQNLKDKVNFERLNYQYVYMHDWWLALIAAEFGEVAFVNEKTMLYRQHSNNVEGSLQRHTLKQVIHQITNYDYDLINMKKVIKIAKEFSVEYGDYMSGEDKDYAEKYGELLNRSGFWHNLVLAFKLPPQERSIKGKIFFSYLMVVFNKRFIES